MKYTIMILVCLVLVGYTMSAPGRRSMDIAERFTKLRSLAKQYDTKKRSDYECVDQNPYQCAYSLFQGGEECDFEKCAYSCGMC